TARVPPCLLYNGIGNKQSHSVMQFRTETEITLIELICRISQRFHKDIKIYVVKNA
ncbi:MAG: hypothetical protein K0Q85_1055, partial [Caproiciproducens sp.]|nr:hypothetical protein [Caproiciproducens sp.]